ncbi:amino acid synthesis family protein [Ramlibacter sp.]|uniref:amino acid synthesis family protein n=1 Tax=Ramlibacter sp. TaxID=1917967 RepID=UPI002FC642D8
MSTINVRKWVLIVEDTNREAGRDVDPPLRKVAAIAVVENPFAGRYVEDLSPLVDFGEVLGDKLTRRAVEALQVAPGEVKGYGKASIVGIAGEIEHCAALIHPKMGKPLRAAVDGGTAIIPSTKKRGGPGTRIDVPFFFKDDEWWMPYLDAMEVSVPDAPGPDEVVVVVALSSGGRPLARVGGQRETKEERQRRAGGR